MMSPVIAMLRNDGRQPTRFHPIVFVEDALPATYDVGNVRRYRSNMHHTAGFATREEAIRNAREDLAPRVEPMAIGPVTFALEEDIPWDGQGVPAIKCYFVQGRKGLVAGFLP